MDNNESANRWKTFRGKPPPRLVEVDEVAAAVAAVTVSSTTVPELSTKTTTAVRSQQAPGTSVWNMKAGSAGGSTAPTVGPSPVPKPTVVATARPPGNVWNRTTPPLQPQVSPAPSLPVEQVVSRPSSAKSDGSPQKRCTKVDDKRISDFANIAPRPIRAAREALNEPKIQIKVNHYEVNLRKTAFPGIIYHYDLTINNCEDVTKGKGREPGDSKLPDRILPAIWAEFQAQNKDLLKYATPFDGKKNFYTARRLELPKGDAYTAKMEMLDPDDPDKKRTFQIVFKLVAEVETSGLWEFLKSGQVQGSPVVQPQDVVQGLDVALRYAPSKEFIQCNRSFFTTGDSFNLTTQLELLFGHYQSLCLGCDEKATLNLDLATKAFYKEMSLTFYLRRACGLTDKDSMDLEQWSDPYIQMANEALKGKLIKYGTGKRDKLGNYENYHKFIAVGLVKESADSYTFEVSGKRLSISEYMKDIKNTDVTCPKYPVVHIGNQKMTNYVPLELCSIITQPYRGKMDPTLTSKMIKGAAVGPVNRFKHIQKSREGCRYEACKVLEEFGIEVGNTMIQITDAHRLRPPTIRTGAGTTDRLTQNDATNVDQKEGKWCYKGKSEPNQRSYLIPATVPKFAVLNCANDVQLENICTFLNQLVKLGEEHGMKEFRQQRKVAEIKNIQAVRKEYQEKSRKAKVGMPEVLDYTFGDLKKRNYKLVIVVMSNDGKEYSMIKTSAEVQVGVLTACVKSKNVNESKNQTLVNYLLKLNSKLNGQNFSVQQLIDQYLKVPTMILGADVTHPSPNSTAPSIAAVTASFNLSGMGYTMHIQPQDSRQELIKNMGHIVEGKLKEFYTATKGQFPKVLIMFRDGVSEGYFDQVKAEEYEGIRKVCDALVKTHKVKITFLIVKKRHHTRFQPSDPIKDGVGAYKNVPPGTVVDSRIIHPAEREFFLNSHVGIQGTSKPTRYHVIHDDSDFKMGDIMRLTYYLCYGFVRCTQPVSYPAATYYAHLAAYRARNLLEREGENADLEALQRQLTIHPDLKRNYPMFFV